MYDYRPPGVYYERADPPARIVARRTDIAGFVGIAERGPLHCPLRIESWTQFYSTFGGHLPQAFLAYAVEGFLVNGGRTCWVVRVADPEKARPAYLDVMQDSTVCLLRLVASSPGRWGQKLTLRALQTGPARYTLWLKLQGGEQEVWRNIDFTNLDASDPQSVLRILNDPQTGSRLVRVCPPDTPVEADDAALPLVQPEPFNPFVQRETVGRFVGGAEGLRRLQVDHFAGRGALWSLTPGGALITELDKPWGLTALELVDEVSIIAMPDMMSKCPVVFYHQDPAPRCEVLPEDPLPSRYEPPLSEYPPELTDEQLYYLQYQMIAQCQVLRDRFAVLDTPVGNCRTGLSPADAVVWRKPFDTGYAALYYPWLRVPDPLELSGLLRMVPPSGHIAGIYARTDWQAGPHKPPANAEVESARDVVVPVTDEIHGWLNSEAVNVIRTTHGRALRVLGARTLSSDAEWRYVNVRRLFMMITEAIDEQTQWTVFEPNSELLWLEITRVVRNFLLSLWQRGMLDGATPDEAFTVVCDHTTNLPPETSKGLMVCEVGVRLPWPAEFVTVRIGITEHGAELMEGDA